MAKTAKMPAIGETSHVIDLPLKAPATAVIIFNSYKIYLIFYVIYKVVIIKRISIFKIYIK